MGRPRFFWQIFPAVMLITSASLLVVTLLFSGFLKDFFIDQLTVGLEARARLLQENILSLLEKEDYAALDRFCKEAGRRAATRLTVVLPDGRVVADTEEEPARMDNHADRREIITAFGGASGRSVRFSNTLGRRMLYLALPLFARASNEVTIAAVFRLSLPVSGIDAALRQMFWKISGVCLATLLLAAIVAWRVSQGISRPLESIRRGAERLAAGDFSAGITCGAKGGGSAEVASLAATLNRMAAELDKRLHTVVRQHHELQTVFASMVEAVIAVDARGKIRAMNRAAMELLHLEADETVGRRVLEVIRNVSLQRFITDVLNDEGKKPLETDIELHAEGDDRFLQAHGAVLRDADGRRAGALVVLNDVTRLQKLENMRREFVANVSHELKTPITTIKGFLETLLDGALKDTDNARHFLSIILKNTNRLDAIIEDLLTLSRIEQEGEQGEVDLEDQVLEPVLAAALDACALRAAEKNITLRLDCDNGLAAAINGPLLEQAIVNLVINGIKYSEPGGEVVVSGRRQGDRVVLAVRDFGVGISREHLPRLFERFYRSDKARSRKQGGTGLGLAIVKHIVQTHHGTVTVDSAPGEGAVFTITLPAVRNQAATQ